MRLEWARLGDQLLEACADCRDEAILVAPFMKAESLRRFFANLPSSVAVTCITRWRLEEFALGVSDLDCWKRVSERGNSKLMLLSNLHTKYFRFDDTVYIGSANLTMAALGWSRTSNVEALVRFSSGSEHSSAALESVLLSRSVEASQELFEQFESMLLSMPVASRFKPEPQTIEALDTSSIGGGVQAVWFPRFRSPEVLFRIYSGVADVTSVDALRDAIGDLSYFEIPAALNELEFRDLIRSRLAAAEALVRLDRFLTERRRFGEVRSWLRNEFQVKDSTSAWQTLMRWLLYFLPDRYEAETPNYSEIFGRKPRPARF